MLLDEVGSSNGNLQILDKNRLYRTFMRKEKLINLLMIIIETCTRKKNSLPEKHRPLQKPLEDFRTSKEFSR